MLLIETQNRTFLLLPGETEKLLLHSKKKEKKHMMQLFSRNTILHMNITYIYWIQKRFRKVKRAREKRNT